MNKRHPAFSIILILSMFINVLISPFASAVPVLAAGIPLIDDFEAGLPVGKDGNNLGIGFNTFQDPNSAVAITTTATPPAPVPGAVSPNNVLQMNVNVISFAGFAHTFENAAVNQWVTQDWSAYAGISFWLYGNNSGTTMFVDVLDNRNPGSIKDDAERWSVDVKDDFSGWKLIQLPFDGMHRKEIGNGAPNDGFGLTEVNGWAFGTIVTPSPQIYYLDNVSVYGVAPIRPLTVGFSAIDYKVTEGATATVTAKLSKPSSNPVTVSYATTIGGAIVNRDYTPAAGTLTFAPNITQQSFSVPTFNDTKYQGERGVQVELSNPTGGAALGIPPVARVTILDNEAYDPTLLDDFETPPYLLNTTPNLALGMRTIKAGDPLALPGQGAFEGVLDVTRNGPGVLPGLFVHRFAQGQDWSSGKGLNFWFYGNNTGRMITTNLLDNQAASVNPSQWKLAWSDEFNSKRGTAPNPNVWGREVGDGVAIGNPGWGNDELQYYTDGTNNAATDGKGNLVITVKAADGVQQCYYGPCKYTSARLLTKNRFEMAYGRVEARIKVPRGAGLWPAFWMLGTDIDQVNWPQTGEIDIMENVGRLPNQVFGTLHGPGYAGGQSYGRSYDFGKPVADDFHTFTVEWQPNKIVWYVDGIQYHQATPTDAFLQGKQWVYNHPFFMLLNVAVGGNFGGAVGADTTFPQAMTVDYVRLYQSRDSAERFGAEFADNFTGWKRISLPFSTFKRSALQLPGAPNDGLTLTSVQGYGFTIPFNYRVKNILVDQIRLEGTPPTKTQMDLPVTFDSPTVAYGLLGFGGADDSTIVVDPTGGANQVAKVVKSATAELWAGTTLTGNGTLGFANKVPFTASATKMTVRVYSPDAGIQVRLKVEDHTNPGISVETEATTTVTNAWETLTFDFANQAAGTASLNLTNTYDKASIFFNFGVTGATVGAKTYYFDDVVFVPASGGGGTWSPITFDENTITYTLTGFGGAEDSTVFLDPTGGTNKVAKVVKSATAELWAGTTVSTGANFSIPTLPFTASSTKMTVRVYSPDAGIQVRLKVEDAAGPTKSVETEATTTVANAWETLTFDFANQAAGTAALNLTFTYNKVSIFFNFGVTGATAGAKTYYFDNVAFPGGVITKTQMDLPVTFDSPTVAYGLLGFGGADDSTIVVDPTSGANQVAKVVKSATAELWAGTTLTGNGTLGFANKVPFTAASTKMTVRIYSPDAGIQVRLKVEDAADPTKSVETEATTTVANAWETLTFDFANQAAGTAALNLAYTYNKASIFFNFGVTGATAGAKTYYFDDVAFLGGVITKTQMDLPVTFDSPTVAYGLLGFGGADDSTIVVDPAGGTNQVAKVVKSATAELWAGTTLTANGTLGFANKVPFTAASTKITVRVYSPDAGIQVRLKVEDHINSGISVETEATTTVANAWETLTFDFANQVAGTAALNLANTYDKASIFFNFGVTGTTAGAKTYYFDDVAFGGGNPPPPTTWDSITFDSSAITYTLTGFGGADDSTVVIDPVGGTNKVAKVVKSATAEPRAGTTVSTGPNFSVPTLPFTASSTKMTVRIYSPDAGIQVRLKVENAADPTKSVETEATTTVANAWETLTFDFANQAAGTAALSLAYTYNKVSIFFNFGVTGATAGAKTYYFDDVAFGGTPPPPTTWSPITFDASTLTYTLTGFGGADDSTVVVDPTNAANKVAKVLKSATAELWAGTTVSTGPNNSVPALPFTAASTKMTVRVWSPDAGIQVRLKVETAGDPTRSVETEATTTVANAWETLTFDFANQAAGTAALNLAYTYNRASIFFNFGVTGATAGAKTYYFDDVTFGP